MRSWMRSGARLRADREMPPTSRFRVCILFLCVIIMNLKRLLRNGLRWHIIDAEFGVSRASDYKYTLQGAMTGNARGAYSSV
jgi:hypothetical protein